MVKLLLHVKKKPKKTRGLKTIVGLHVSQTDAGFQCQGNYTTGGFYLLKVAKIKTKHMFIKFISVVT